jgi:cell division protein FtsL
MLNQPTTRRNYYKNESSSDAQPDVAPVKSSFWRNFAQQDFRLDQELLFRAMPYFIYMALLGLIYIANRHYTDRIVREVISLRMEVEEMRVDYITLKSQFISKSQRQEIAKKAKKLGLDENDEVKVSLKP